MLSGGPLSPDRTDPSALPKKALSVMLILYDQYSRLHHTQAPPKISRAVLGRAAGARGPDQRGPRLLFGGRVGLRPQPASFPAPSSHSPRAAARQPFHARGSGASAEQIHTNTHTHKHKHTPKHAPRSSRSRRCTVCAKHARRERARAASSLDPRELGRRGPSSLL